MDVTPEFWSALGKVLREHYGVAEGVTVTKAFETAHFKFMESLSLDHLVRHSDAVLLFVAVAVPALFAV